MIKELNEEITEKLSELITVIADEHIIGKPQLLATGMFYSVEKFLISKINEIETTFKG
ncbi:MAG: hypothetical protein JRJ00_00390 [Deltaproteobacteria bacterium]|nr:hypothetical protein [Deltaproteobacteria bacterium]